MPEPSAMNSRITGTYLAQVRKHRGGSETYQTWHERIDQVHDILEGDFITILEGEEADIDKPLIQNTAEKRVRDVTRLVTEVTPLSRGTAKNDEKDEEIAARVRAAIADTYWEENEAEVLFTPEWAMDLQIAGAAFAVAWMPDEVDKYGERYPKFERVDPRMCYPGVANGKLFDLMVVKEMKVDLAEEKFPGKGIKEAYASSKRANSGWEDSVEVWEYYTKDETVRALSFLKNKKPVRGGVNIIDRSPNKYGCPLAVMVKLPTWDAWFHGHLDQIKGSLYAKNKAVKLIMDHTEEAVTASLEAKGIVNADEPPHKGRIYQHDPTVPDSKIGRVPPATFNPMILQVLGLLDREQHSELSYPAARQGVVSQSIASAAFTESVQGDLTSVVREIHRLLAKFRREITLILAKLDVAVDEQKPLLRSVGKRHTYKPKKDWDGRYKVNFVYGPSSGLGIINGDQRLVQFNGIGVMSQDTLRSHVPDLFPDPESEADKMERETNTKAIQQRFLTDPSVTLDTIVDTLMIQEKEGKSLVEALMQVREAQKKAEAEAPTEPAAEQLPQPAGPEMGPVDAEAEALALEKGKVPTEGGPEQLELEEAIPARILPQMFINQGGR